MSGETAVLLTRLGSAALSDPAAIILSIAALRDAVTKRDRQVETLQAQLRQKRTQQEAGQKQLEELRRLEQQLMLSLSACRTQQDEYSRTVAEKRTALHRLTKGIPILVLLTQVEGELAELRQAESAAEASFSSIQAEFLATQQQLAIDQTQSSGLSEQVRDSDTRMQRMLAEFRFDTVQAVENAYLDQAVLEEKRMMISSYQDKEHKLAVQREELMNKLADRHMSQESWQEITLQLQTALQARDQAAEVRITAERDLRDLTTRHERWQTIENALVTVREQLAHLTTLKSLLRGNAMVEFMAQEQMDVVLIHASERLKQLTNNRYGLELASDGNVFNSR